MYQPLKQWLTREKRSKEENTKIWISRERKELFRWNKKHLSKFLKGYHLVKNTNLIENSGTSFKEIHTSSHIDSHIILINLDFIRPISWRWNIRRRSRGYSLSCYFPFPIMNLNLLNVNLGSQIFTFILAYYVI